MKLLSRSFIISVIILVSLIQSKNDLLAQASIQVFSDALRPIIGATITQATDTSVLLTDDKGQVSLNISVPTTYFIRHQGYLTQEIILRTEEARIIILQTSTLKLDEIEVEGFLRNGNLDKQAGSISKLGAGAFERFNKISLVNAVNTLPGIRFEERASGSYRISIRGSSIRAPFGVRNVKVYWNEIPFTEPGGNTFINLLDVANVGNLEIIKGPAGSLYGAGTGGVMKIRSTTLKESANTVSAGITTGSFGLLKLNAGFNSFSKNGSYTLKFARQKSNGYRDHNYMNRHTVELDAVVFSDQDITLTASLLYSDLFYEIPGGLNADQVAENPKQARAGSELQNSSVDNNLFLIKVGQEYNFSRVASNETNLYGSFNQFENPFILDYKKDNQQIFGGRSVFDFQFSKVSIQTGIEYQNSFFDGKNFGNVLGEADTIRFADEIKTTMSNVFVQGNMDLGSSVSVSAGLSINSLKYDIDRLIDAFNQTPEQIEKKFETALMPRIAVSKTLMNNLSLHASLSKGFSPPTTTEIRTNDGKLSPDLEPEKGTNYELNFRGALFKNKLSFDLATFYFNLDETIVSNPNQDGVLLFENAGQTSQKGIELQLKSELFSSTEGIINRIDAGISYTLHDFEFKDYVKRENDYSGNALPGTAKNSLNSTLDINFLTWLTFNMTYHYVDPIPLNDANSFYSDAYHLLNSRLNFNYKNQYEIFFGVDNLTNASYSLGNDLNAFGRRYFQPALEINFYFGINLKLHYK
jgi:iron complex outermembrane recepter protein